MARAHVEYTSGWSVVAVDMSISIVIKRVCSESGVGCTNLLRISLEQSLHIVSNNNHSIKHFSSYPLLTTEKINSITPST